MSAQIINLANWKHDRRVAAELAERDQAKAAAVQKRKDQYTQDLGGSLGASIVASVAVELEEKQREAEQAGKWMPAYCDPDNEVRGAKYEASRDLDIAEIAKRMRADIKALDLGKGFKISVRIQRYSGGQSIDVRVQAVPAGFKILSDKAASWIKQFPNDRHRMPLSPEEAASAEWWMLRQQLEQIHGAYNRDNSDSMCDYFHRRYYGDADMCWQLRHELEEAELAASSGDLWAESCAR